MNAFIYKTVWRSGVVLKSGGNTALVKADTEDRKIYIWINGDQNTRRDFLSAIRMEFDAIHKTIAKIQATEKVPFPSQPQVPPVDYEFLLRLEHEGRSTFPIQAGNEIIDIDVKQLLDGIDPPDQRRTELSLVRRMENDARPIPLSTPQLTKPVNKLVIVLKKIATFPKYIGRFVFDLFGRHESAESSSIILGWILVLVIVSILQGFISPDRVIKFFSSIWRFFTPIK
jgi:hypothetical protein